MAEEDSGEPGPDNEKPKPPRGRLGTWTAQLTDFQKFLAAATGSIAAIGVLVGTAVGVVHLIGSGGGNPTAAPSQSSSIQDGGPIPSTTSPPTSTSPPPSTPSPSQTLNISVVCKLPAAVHEGQQTTATYVITSNQAVKVGLGAGVYGSDGTDYSNGDGDMDGYQLKAGTQSVTRELILPSGLQSDQYEIDAEIWPSGEIGANGANTLAEATCGYFNVS